MCKYELLNLISFSRKKTVLWWGGVWCGVGWGGELSGVGDRNSCVYNVLTCNLSKKEIRRKEGERDDSKEGWRMNE